MKKPTFEVEPLTKLELETLLVCSERTDTKVPAYFSARAKLKNALQREAADMGAHTYPFSVEAKFSKFTKS